MKTLQLLQKNRKKIYEIAEKYGVSNIRVFGSVARGEEKKNSDVDLLVDFSLTKSKSGFALISFENELEKTFKKDFEITTKKALHPLIKNEIITTAKNL